MHRGKQRREDERQYSKNQSDIPWITNQKQSSSSWAYCWLSRTISSSSSSSSPCVCLGVSHQLNCNSIFFLTNDWSRVDAFWHLKSLHCFKIEHWWSIIDAAAAGADKQIAPSTRVGNYTLIIASYGEFRRGPNTQNQVVILAIRVSYTVDSYIDWSTTH